MGDGGSSTAEITEIRTRRNVWGVTELYPYRDEAKSICTGGLPLWHAEGGDGGTLLPLGGQWEADLPPWLQTIMYLVGLLYCFMGVAIIADVFMGAIEKITSKKKLVENPHTKKKVTVKVWNDTVANLTLMALGSSAPEILLSMIELVTGEFFSGELGPSTIVGSAAFNLFCITAVCVIAIPAGEVRMIKDTGVFAVTAFFSIFAYIWVWFILSVPSPDVISIAEGVMTFMWFWVLLVLAFLADIGVLSKVSKGLVGHSNRLVFSPDCSKEELAEMELLIRKKYGSSVGDEEIVALMEHEFAAPRSRAEYRVDATRGFTKGKKVISKNTQDRKDNHKRLSNSLIDNTKGDVASSSLGSTNLQSMTASELLKREETTVSFASANYSVIEAKGLVVVTVNRTGDRSKPTKVGYKTRDGTAKGGDDYEKVDSVLEFAVDEKTKSFNINIVHDQSHEKTEEFYVDLTALEGCTIGTIKSATIVVIDSDSPGKLAYEHEQMHVQESAESTRVTIVVNRTSGATGRVSCNYCTEDDSAVEGKDYVAVEGELTFESGQMSASFEVEIMPKGRYEGTECFRVILKDPQGEVRFDESTDGGREQNILTVFIVADPTTRGHVDKAMRYLDVNWDRIEIGHSRWKEQFTEAIYCGGSKEDQAEAGISDWISHLISLPWKVLFAVVPPTDFAGGWICFFSALAMIGFVTAIIGDMANLLGCALGVNPSITAITFVALGTSLPDTFASKTAAMQDPFADASIGNITGSNSVNVFLGLGLPWMIGAIYWQILGANHDWNRRGWEVWPDRIKIDHPEGAFVVIAGSLGKSVAVFCVCGTICLGTLSWRRKVCKGELGGNKRVGYISAVFFVILWLIYIGCSIYFDSLPVDGAPSARFEAR